MDEKELKPKSFRINDATSEKIREIAAELGTNQQETLSKLIEAYEFQAGKAILTDKKDDIDQFERYVTLLTRMFMASLEDNQNMSATIRTEYDAQFMSKDKTIQELQKHLEIEKELRAQATNKAKEATKESIFLN